MSFLDKLFSRKPKPGQRIRICQECGMPIAEHREWCSIFRTAGDESERQGGRAQSRRRQRLARRPSASLVEESAVASFR